MARRLASLPGARAGRHAIYPWDEWLDGTPWLLVEGEDFDCSLPAMRSAAWQAAAARGLGVWTRQHEEGLVIQTYVPA